MFNAILLTFLSGIVGTAVGGALSLFFKLNSNRAMSALLSFSAGMMMSMICFDLLPEALEHSSILFTVVGCAIGVIILLLLDGELHHHSAHATEEDNLHHHPIHTDSKMLQLGTMMILSVSLHNFPEGLAIGSSSVYQLETGIIMALLLTMHNIPEGMGMIAPLIKGGMSKFKALMWVAMSGFSTLLGGIIGALFSNISAQWIALTLSLAAGCMLYVTYFEILPQVQLMEKGKRPFLYQIFGFLLGFVLITFI